MVLECGNGAFCSIGAVIVWWDELDSDVVAAYKCSNSRRAFVVHHVEVDGLCRSVSMMLLKAVVIAASFFVGIGRARMALIS
jgi:hypothetical protein